MRFSKINTNTLALWVVTNILHRLTKYSQLWWVLIPTELYL